MEVNFFWIGKNFTFLHKITILSHLRVGHNPIIWLHGDPPENENWVKGINGIKIKNSSEIYDIDNFLKTGGNFKTASALWRFNFLYQRGGWYCDTDAVAIKPWDDIDDDWVITTAETRDDLLSIGIIKAPAKEELFVKAISDIKPEWGNVLVFTEAYKTVKGNTTPTHSKELFYPFNWEEWDILFQDVPIPDCYSIHLYHTMLERNNKVIDNTWRDSNTLLGRIIKNVI